jgi:hypothetical protein
LYINSPTIHLAISSTTLISSLVGKYELAGLTLETGVSCPGTLNLTNLFGPLLGVEKAFIGANSAGGVRIARGSCGYRFSGGVYR